MLSRDLFAHTKITTRGVNDIRRLYKLGCARKDIAKKYGVSYAAVYRYTCSKHIRENIDATASKRSKRVWEQAKKDPQLKRKLQDMQNASREKIRKLAPTGTEDIINKQ